MPTSPRRRLLAAMIGAAALAPLAGRPAHADNSQPGPGSQLRRDVKGIHALGVSGVQARVRIRGREWSATAGRAELSDPRPVPSNGYFRMASASKTLVATVVLQLVAEGSLALDDTLERRLPGVDLGNVHDGSRITVRHLLQHTSGISDDLPGYTTPAEYEEQRFIVYTRDELITRSLRQPPAFPPGEGWEYANTGYFLLGMIIRATTGTAPHLAIRDRILVPLHLRHTRWQGTATSLPSPHAHAYQLFGPGARTDVTEQIPVDVEDWSFVTTTRDQITFFQALLAGKLLPPEQLRAMKTTVPVSESVQPLWPGGRYGLGLVWRPLSGGGSYWSHEGGDGGFITLNGVTEDGSAAAAVSMSEARGDTWEHVLDQERAASDLIDHALSAAR